MNQLPLVSICMITYGHEKFIEEAINGVLMQECDFEYELIIANDSSPDNSDDVINTIIKNHQKGKLITYFKQEKNIGMMPNFISALEQCKGNYIAVCEGDDHWTDPLKLQKQVDFLNVNTNYSACFTNINMLNNGILSKEVLKKKHKKDFDSISVFYDLWVPTLTILYRKNSLKLPLPDQFSKVNNGDLFLFYLLAQEGMLGYLDFVSGVYRQHENGVWSGEDTITQIEKRITTFVLIKDYFNENLKIKQILQEKITASNWLKVRYFFKKRLFKKFVLGYTVFFIKNPFFGILNIFLKVKKMLVKPLKK